MDTAVKAVLTLNVAVEHFLSDGQIVGVRATSLLKPFRWLITKDRWIVLYIFIFTTLQHTISYI